MPAGSGGEAPGSTGGPATAGGGESTSPGGPTVVTAPISPAPQPVPAPVTPAPPTAADDTASTTQNTPVTLTASQLLANDTAPSGETLTLTSVSNAQNGSITFDSSHDTVTFTPTSGFVGSGGFQYQVTDTDGLTAKASVAVTVSPPAAPPPPPVPTVGNDTAQATANTPTTIPAASLLANDTPGTAGDTLTISGVSNPVHGNVSLTPAGDINFAPENGFTGAASFAYTVAEQHGGSATGQVQVNVAPPAAPTAGADTVFVPQNQTTPVSPLILLANDTASAPNDPLHVQAVSGGANGTVVLGSGGPVFTPQSGFTGSTSFGYTVADQFGSSANSNVTVNVTPYIAPASVSNGTPVFKTGFDAPLSFNADELTSLQGIGAYSPNWAPVSGSAAVPMITQVGAASHGTVSFDAGSGQITFTPDHGFAGTANFSWTLNGPQLPAQSVQVSVSPPPAPTAVNDSLSGNENTSMVIPATQLLGNDKPVLSDDPLHLSAVSGAQHATVSLSPHGDVNFMPDSGFSGVSTFNYTVADQFGQSAQGTVAVGVQPTPQPAPPPQPQPQPAPAPVTQVIQQTQQVEITQVQQVSVNPITIVQQPPTSAAAPSALAYFNGTSQAHGSELWSYNGQSVGEAADINPGAASSFPANLAYINNTLFFSADDGTHGREPWTFDGQKAVMLADINPGSGSSDPQGFTQLLTPPPSGGTTTPQSSVYFSADDGSHGRELWVDDPSGNVHMVGDINPGSAGSNPTNLTPLAGTLYFTANDGSHGTELWSVGKSGTPTQVADLNPGAAGSQPGDLTVLGNTLYFIANDGTHGRELFSVSNGGTPTEQIIGNGSATAFPAAGADHAMLTMGSKLYFVATVPGQGAELFRESEGDKSPTPVASLGGAANASLVSVQSAAAGHDLYFAVTDSLGNSQLARYDTTTGVLTPNIAPDNQDVPADLTAVGNQVFFTVLNHNVLGDLSFRDLYTDNGQTTQKIQLGGNATLPHDPTAAGNQLLFSDFGQMQQVSTATGNLSPTTLTVAGGQIYVPLDITAAPHEMVPLG